MCYCTPGSGCAQSLSAGKAKCWMWPQAASSSLLSLAQSGSVWLSLLSLPATVGVRQTGSRLAQRERTLSLARSQGMGMNSAEHSPRFPGNRGYDRDWRSSVRRTVDGRRGSPLRGRPMGHQPERRSFARSITQKRIEYTAQLGFVKNFFSFRDICSASSAIADSCSHIFRSAPQIPPLRSASPDRAPCAASQNCCPGRASAREIAR